MAATGAGETRAMLLDAAGRLVLSEGVTSLTLEAVAREAGVSKGGLLYHFPNKEALIRGMIAALLAGFDQQLDDALAASEDAEQPGAWLRAYVRSTYTPEPDAVLLSAGLLVAAATNPELLAPMQERFRQWQARAEQDGIDPTLATLIRLAADGLWLADLLGFAPPTGTRRAELFSTLLSLTQETT